MNPLLRALSQLVSQDVARANAGAAVGELRRRRRETEDADAFLAGLQELPGLPEAPELRRLPGQRSAAGSR